MLEGLVNSQHVGLGLAAWRKWGKNTKNSFTRLGASLYFIQLSSPNDSLCSYFVEV